MERDGYVTRTAYPTIPPKVEYSLTSLGASLLVVIEPLVEWADRNHEQVNRAREAYVLPPSATAL